MRFKNKVWGIILAILLGALFVGVIVNTESFKRWSKSLGSNFSGGMNRVVSVYDFNGNLLRTYEGYIDIQDTEYGNKVLFDLDGERIVLYNCSVIAEEVKD